MIKKSLWLGLSWLKGMYTWVIMQDRIKTWQALDLRRMMVSKKVSNMIIKRILFYSVEQTVCRLIHSIEGRFAYAHHRLSIPQQAWVHHESIVDPNNRYSTFQKLSFRITSPRSVGFSFCFWSLLIHTSEN